MVSWIKSNRKVRSVELMPRGGLLPTTPITARGLRRLAARQAAQSQG